MSKVFRQSSRHFASCVCIFTVVNNCFDAIKFTEWTCYDGIIVGKNLPNLDGHHLVSNLLAVGFPMPFFQMLDENETEDPGSKAKGFRAIIKKPLTSDRLARIIDIIQNEKEKISDEYLSNDSNPAISQVYPSTAMKRKADTVLDETTVKKASESFFNDFGMDYCFTFDDGAILAGD
jgi:DNA-binding NtrC family response regulator